MRFLIAYSGAIAFVVFIIALVASLFFNAAWTDRLTIAAVPSIITFVALLFLANGDSARRYSAIKAVRSHLLSCKDSTDEAFVSTKHCESPALLLETRKAIAKFFDVPTVKVARDVHLVHDLCVDKLQPSFQSYVVDSVIACQPVHPQSFGFAMAGLDSIDDLTNAILKVLDDFDRNAQTDNERNS